jgi:hypothetical protein
MNLKAADTLKSAAIKKGDSYEYIENLHCADCHWPVYAGHEKK